MASEPTVCAVMLTRDRPEMARRAVECFRRQTYPAKRLLIVNSGPDPLLPGDEEHNIAEPCFIGADALTIGELRNMAMDSTDYRPYNTRREADIIVHFDDDDWSHPERIAEQVSLLQASGAAAVGYHEMLFWRETPKAICDQYAEVQRRYPADPRVPVPAHLRLRLGEAWLYRGSILGTSLCYWRETWERVPFRAIRLNPNHQQGTGEDHDFLLDLPAAGMKTAQQSSVPMSMEQARALAFPEGPRMIGGIHGANTSGAYDPAQMHAHPQHWTRVPAWDKFCLETMKR